MRRLFANPRGLGALIAACALLTFLNVSELERTDAAAFESASYVAATDLEMALSARYTGVVVHAAIEYASLVVIGLGAGLVLVGPRLVDARWKRRWRAGRA